jgi:hypothetical protein
LNRALPASFLLVLLACGTRASGQSLPAEPPAPAAPTTHPNSRVRFAAHVESALGVSGGAFYNQLAGARFDYRFTDELCLGHYLGYANLKGHDGRAHGFLPYLQLEYRPSLGAGAFGLPLRFATGYLLKNGPVMRLSVGVSYALTPQVALVVDVVTPTFWVVGNRTVISLGGALEVSYAP